MTDVPRETSTDPEEALSLVWRLWVKFFVFPMSWILSGGTRVLCKCSDFRTYGWRGRPRR